MLARIDIKTPLRIDRSVLLCRKHDLIARVVADVEGHGSVTLERPSDGFTLGQLVADLCKLARIYADRALEATCVVPGDFDQFGASVNGNDRYGQRRQKSPVSKVGSSR